jgi:hypothetical protein
MAYDVSDYVDQALWDLIDLLEQALTPTFLFYLEKTYGKNDWPRAVAQKQPWNIKDLFGILVDQDHFAFPKFSWSKLTLTRAQFKIVGKDLERSKRNGRALITIGDFNTLLKDLRPVLELMIDAGLEDMHTIAIEHLKEIESTLNSNNH